MAEHFFFVLVHWLEVYLFVSRKKGHVNWRPAHCAFVWVCRHMRFCNECWITCLCCIKVDITKDKRRVSWRWGAFELHSVVVSPRSCLEWGSWMLTFCRPVEHEMLDSGMLSGPQLSSCYFKVSTSEKRKYQKKQPCSGFHGFLSKFGSFRV